MSPAMSPDLREVAGARVLRVDRHRRDPGAVRPDLRRPGVQDPERLDGGQPPHRRSPAGQQVHLRRRPDRGRAGAAAGARHPPRRRHRLQVSRRSRTATSSSASSACRARRWSSGARPSTSTASRSTRPPFHLKFKSPAPAEGAPQHDKVDSFGPVTVPAGHLFMMGDNRDDSLDSRYWNFLPLTYVKGRAMTIYFSYDPDATGAGQRAHLDPLAPAVPPGALNGARPRRSRPARRGAALHAACGRRPSRP